MEKMPLTLKMKQEKIKMMLLDAVIIDCEKNPQKCLYWAQQWSAKLLPTETTIKNSDDESFKIKYENTEELSRQIAGLEARIAGLAIKESEIA